MRKRMIYVLMTGLCGQVLLSSCEKEEIYLEPRVVEEFSNRDENKEYSNGSNSSPYYMVTETKLYPLPKPDVDPNVETDPEPDPWTKN